MRTEREKMLAGEWYDASDADLSAARERADALCKQLNATRETEIEERRRICAALFAAGGDVATIRPPFFCDYGSNIRLGMGVYFNFNCVVLDVCLVTVGDRTLFGPAVQIYAATHPLNAELRKTVEAGKPVTIGSDVWVGGGTVICPGISIGDRAVIGAGSVVTRDIPAGVLAVGNPCRVVRPLDA
jgi:maltose O-acetyltransferase